MDVLLSIKPKYAELILAGNKKYEFRRTLFKSKAVEKIVIYASSPIQKVIGEFEVDGILSFNPDKLWEITINGAGIDKKYFDTYFLGKKVAHAIKIKNAQRYSIPKALIDYGVDHPPQSFMYIKKG